MNSTIANGRLCAQLGYGDGDERSVVSFGPDEDSKPISTYYRKSIQISDPTEYTELWIDLLADHAAAVYLNGQLVVRDNLPDTFDHATPAESLVDGEEEETFHTFSVDPSLLRSGVNVIAVELHQFSATDADASFDLRLRGTIEGVAVSLPTVADRDTYTLDLTGRTGRRLDILLAGQQGVDFTQGSSVQLFDPSGTTLLAEAESEFEGVPTSNYDLAIHDFIVPGDGVYRIQVESQLTGTYALLVSDGAVFDTEPNQRDATGALRHLAVGDTAFGHVAVANPSSTVDPQGDTRATSMNADISSMDVHVEGDSLIVSVSFYDSIQPAADDDGTFIYVELDVDQDASTGRPSLQNQGYVPGQTGGPLGVDFVVNASPRAGNQAFLADTCGSGQTVTQVPMTTTDTSFRIEIPLSNLNQDDGIVNAGMLSGRLDVSDAGPTVCF